MIKKLSIIICLCLGLTFVACTKDKTNENTVTNKTVTTETTEPKKESKNEEPIVVKQIVLTTYTANSDTYAVEKLSDIKIDETSTLQEKLKALADEISAKVFKGLPITIVGIETSNNLKKAIINLEEKDGTDPNASWSRVYFQGTAGGAITTKTLTETFRQKSYTGEWVDSIEFHYNGNKIDFQHVPNLSEPVKR